MICSVCSDRHGCCVMYDMVDMFCVVQFGCYAMCGELGYVCCDCYGVIVV